MSIRFSEVSKSFGDRKVLNHVSFEIRPGEILFILGKSGAGKSVTLKQIVGLLQPDEGQVFVENIEVSRLSRSSPDDRKILSQMRQKCGMVFQHPALFDSLTIFENIAFGLRAQNLSDAEISQRVLEMLSAVHLDKSIMDSFPASISYGMQKRVSIARTLSPRPSYLLFDEPTTGLDPITTRAINELILELSRIYHITSVVVSHDMTSALHTADRIVVLDEGRLVADDSPEALRQSGVSIVKDFLEETLIAEKEGLFA